MGDGRSRSVRDVIANPTPEEAAQLQALKDRLQGKGRPSASGPGRLAAGEASRAPTLEQIEDVVRRVVREELDARGL